jgi:hypothetical protein
MSTSHFVDGNSRGAATLHHAWQSKKAGMFNNPKTVEVKP